MSGLSTLRRGIRMMTPASRPPPGGETGKPKAKEYEVIRFSMKNTVSDLKAVALALGLSGSGNKGPLFNRIWDCTKEAVSKVEDPVAFNYRREKQAEGDVPKRILLTPSAAEEISGIDMATGAQI